jgi:hypothetical protein
MSVEQDNASFEALYPDDITGDLCDAWRAEGRTFTVDERGTPDYYAPDNNEYDQGYFKSMPDIYGAPQDYLDNHTFLDVDLTRLVLQLPLSHVVYSHDENQPNNILRHGIKREYLATVRELVSNAETTMPAGQQIYRPPSTIITSAKAKLAILARLNEVMTPLQEKQAQQDVREQAMSDALAACKRWCANSEQQKLPQQVPRASVESQSTATERKFFSWLSRVGYASSGMSFILTVESIQDDSPTSTQLLLGALFVASAVYGGVTDRRSR